MNKLFDMMMTTKDLVAYVEMNCCTLKETNDEVLITVVQHHLKVECNNHSIKIACQTDHDNCKGGHIASPSCAITCTEQTLYILSSKKMTFNLT